MRAWNLEWRKSGLRKLQRRCELHVKGAPIKEADAVAVLSRVRVGARNTARVMGMLGS